MSANQSMKPEFWDKAGIALSGVCAIHCLLVPVFVSLIPLWPAFADFHEFTHLIFFLAITPAVILSIRNLKHNRRASLYLYIGLVIILLAWLFNSSLGYYGETGITLAGSLLLIRGHWLNYKLKTSCRIAESK